MTGTPTSWIEPVPECPMGCNGPAYRLRLPVYVALSERGATRW